jgi:hypothetical protein
LLVPFKQGTRCPALRRGNHCPSVPKLRDSYKSIKIILTEGRA